MANVRLDPVNGACFDIDHVPQQRGEILPAFNVVDQTVLFFPRYDINNRVINHTRYDQLDNGVTGLPFASFAELVQFCKDYVYKNEGGGGGGAGSPVLRTYLIKVAPAAANEKPEGQYVTDNDLKNLNPDSLILLIADGAGVSQYVGTGTIDYNAGLGRIGLVGGDAGTFADGQTVVVLGTLA